VTPFSSGLGISIAQEIPSGSLDYKNSAQPESFLGGITKLLEEEVVERR
jgi:hypothetical protein